VGRIRALLRLGDKHDTEEAEQVVHKAQQKQTVQFEAWTNALAEVQRVQATVRRGRTRGD
jgi:hypothetical protein